MSALQEFYVTQMDNARGLLVLAGKEVPSGAAYKANTPLHEKKNHLLYITQISKVKNSYTCMLFATCCLKKTSMQCACPSLN